MSGSTESWRVIAVRSGLQLLRGAKEEIMATHEYANGVIPVTVWYDYI